VIGTEATTSRTTERAPRGRDYQQLTFITMTYMRDFKAELERRLENLEEVWKEGDVDTCDSARVAFVKFVCDKTLESYRNGLNNVGAPAERSDAKKTRPFAQKRPSKNARA
jgi:hypothetical protein